jgi:uncharacterized RDD family membrane protein YckC
MSLEEKLFREDIKIASLNKRILAFTIDELVVSIILILGFADKIPATQNYEQMIEFTNSLILYIVLLKFIYHGFFTFMYGKTLGKMVMKIRIIDINTLDKPLFGQSFIRSFLRIISEMFFYIGFLVAYMSPMKQTFHDKLTKVVVVDE